MELHDKTRSAGKGRSSFETILTNIEAAAPYIDVKLRIHVAPFNVARIKGLLVDLAARGIHNRVKEVYFAPLFDYKPAPQDRQFKSDTKRFFDAESYAAVELELLAELKRLGMPIPDLLTGLIQRLYCGPRRMPRSLDRAANSTNAILNSTSPRTRSATW